MQLSDKDFVHRLNSEITREHRSGPIEQFASKFSQSFPGILQANQTPFHTRIPPIVNSIVAGSRASFPLGFGTTVPKLVGSIETTNFLVRDLQRKSGFANTVIMGKSFGMILKI